MLIINHSELGTLDIVLGRSGRAFFAVDVMAFSPVSKRASRFQLSFLPPSSQFEVNVPHIAYTCLGGFIVLVRACSRRRNSSNASLVWHALSLFAGKGIYRSSWRPTPLIPVFTALYW